MARNATSIWLSAALTKADFALKVRRSIMKAIKTIGDEADDLVQDFFCEAIRRDLFAERIEEGKMHIGLVLRAARQYSFNVYRKMAMEPLTREMYNARSSTEDLKGENLAGQSSVGYQVHTDFETGDVRDFSIKMPSDDVTKFFQQRILVEQLWDKVDAATRAVSPKAYERNIRIVTRIWLQDHMSIVVAADEGLTPSAVSQILRSVRGRLEASLDA